MMGWSMGEFWGVNFGGVVSCWDVSCDSILRVRRKFLEKKEDEKWRWGMCN